MATSVKLDTREALRVLGNISKLSKKEFGELLFEEGSLTAKELMDRTPPHNGRKGTSIEAKKQGERSVERYLYNSFSPLKSRLIKNKDLKKTIKKADFNEIDKWFAAINRPQKKATNFSLSQHKRNRDSRGRVSKSTGAVTVDKDYSKWRAALKDQKAQVGTFKAAWANVSILLALQNGKNRAVPAWVKRHLSKTKSMMLQRKIINNRYFSGFAFTVLSHNYTASTASYVVSSRKAALTKKLNLQRDRIARRANARALRR